MEFCPNCGCILRPKKTEVNKQVSVVLACSKCNYVKDEPVRKVEAGAGKVAAAKHVHQESVTVIPKEQEVSTMPTIKMECPKCGNRVCYVWQVQTRGGDEASTQFFRCTKCSHTFREYA
ncbi:MAG: transcription factor S [Candidatus Bathyarchaeia archaeon]|jgi:DNA-directed RNA polymerase subunit M